MARTTRKAPRAQKRSTTPQKRRAAPPAGPPLETLLSLSEAGKLVGVSKSTIWRAIKAGKLSAAAKTEGPIPEFRIEPSELHRAFAETTRAHAVACLLYTSDAADEEDSVDLGGRR